MLRLMSDWDALRSALAGEVLLPDSAGYDVARRPAIVNFDDVRPQAVVVCRSPRDVADAVAFAAEAGLPTAARSGGHCFAGRSSTDGVVIDVTPMSSVSVSDGIATVGAGTRLGALIEALAGHGRALPAGCGPDVGIAGLTLGGGFGILGRRYGLTADQLVGAEVVLADGRVVTCDDEHDEDLFWALRGAGGLRFGIVTSLVFRTVPAPEVTSFRLDWPDTEAAAVIDAWQAWAPTGPDELAASLLVSAPRDVARPPVATVFGTMLGSEGDTAPLLEALVERIGAEPGSASSAQLPYAQTKRHLVSADPRDEGPGYIDSKSEFFRRPLGSEAITALVARLASHRTPGQARVLDFSPWGGAYTRVPADATAFPHRDALFLLKHEVVTDLAAPDAARDAGRAWLADSWAVVHPWGSGGVYPNFPDPDLDDWAPEYYGANLDRLRRIHARYTQPSIMLRRGRPDDAHAIGAVFDAAVRDGWTFLGERAQRQMFTPEDWDRTVSDHAPPNALLVATDPGDGVVGFTAVNAEKGELFLLFVHPDHAGRGIGRALLGAAHDVLRAAGHTKAFLFTEERNTRALSVYTAAGYRPDGTVRESDFDGAPLREPRLVKTL